MEDDAGHMRAALALARRGLGNAWPNPAVGCVLVKDGRIVGRGWTAPGGRPHAEILALQMAGEAQRGATAYVSLEPCCHWGRTPPCTDALIAAGVKRVVIGSVDADPRVNGEGIAKLRAAGIEVASGVLQAEADDLAAGFRMKVQHGRPIVTLKIASTLDGRIAAHNGESRWITGEQARWAGHALRGRHDAVMVGVGTVLTDDPELTCRIPGFRPSPLVRVVADSHLRTPLTARIAKAAHDAPTWMLIREGADPARRAAFAELGVKLISVPGCEVGVEIGPALKGLGGLGITRLLVEGGAQLAAALLRADLVDRISWFHAPSIMGADGVPAVQALGIAALAAMPRFVRERSIALGADMLTEFRRAA
jgi:diaminohydroxyphosphoribosylaminopyrimidine deaminase/5-amino-6-(5-phosphoribosylamino)uracil reductase